MKTACLPFIYGCPRSMMDASKLVLYLRKNGWEITENYRTADLIVMGTCGFHTTSEETSLNFLSITCRKKKKDARIIVFGCLAGMKEDFINNNYNAIAINYRNTDKIDDIISATVKYSEIDEQMTIDPIVKVGTKIYTKFDRLGVKTKLSAKNLGKAFFSAFFTNPEHLHKSRGHMFNIRIAKGCPANCTYCAIKSAVGPLRSKPLDKVLSEFNTALKEGGRTLRLVADDVGGYGQDNGVNIFDLLNRLFDSEADFKLAWDDFNPRWLIKYFPELFAILSKHADKIDYMGFPIQSGSEKILQLMNREYQAADAKRCLLALRQAIPEIDISTHVIVGFPGETPEDFKETMSFLKQVNFKHISAYRYCDRPDVPAAQLPEKVPSLIKYARLWQLKRSFKDTCFIG